MRGIEWGELYEKYKNTAYNPAEVAKKVKEFYGDQYVKNRKGVFEYILGGCVDSIKI